MKKLTIIVFIILTGFFYSCIKEGEDCDQDIGYLEVHNSTDYTYNVYIDSVWYISLDGFLTVTYELPPHHYQVTFVQVWGFDSIPNVHTTYVDVDACSYTACSNYE